MNLIYLVLKKYYIIGGVILDMDDIGQDLENYQKSLDDEKKKTARINWALFLILIIVIIVFVYSLWRYQALN